jgi:glucan 1,3-beta-glucosidase
VSAPLRGVNLGGWLVLEKWMTPSLFDATDAVDEYTFMSTPDAAARLQSHRETFITESDMAWIAEQGLDLVRLPVGHWVLGGDEPYLGAAGLLDAAMDWAATYELAVLLDLHAASGSQNGQDHSGRVGPRRWYRERSHREHTHAALAALATRYANHPTL